MVLFGKSARRAALLSIALGALAFTASAQRAKFTLPFEAHWGSAVLPAGEYTLAPTMTTGWPRVFAVTGGGRTFYIMASVNRHIDGVEGSYLQLDDVDGTKVVRELHSAWTGDSFLFDAPKRLRARLMAQRTTRVVLVDRHG